MGAVERIAVVAPQAGAWAAAQTRPPDDVVAGPDGLRRAHAAGAQWIWVLEHGGAPRPDALELLLAAREPRGPDAAAIVAGAVVDAAGRIREAFVPGLRVEHPDVIGLAGRGLLPIRHAPLAHCLVDREALTRHGFPDTARFGRYAAVEWSARVLRASGGVFVPASAVAADPPAAGAPGLRDVPAFARLLRSGAWSRGDQLAAVTRAVRRG